jgi:hypothetical protein
MLHLNETFASGDQRIKALLAKHQDEPAGFVPQHHLAHVKMPTMGHRNGYPVCYLNRRPA